MYILYYYVKKKNHLGRFSPLDNTLSSYLFVVEKKIWLKIFLRPIGKFLQPGHSMPFCRISYADKYLS